MMFLSCWTLVGREFHAMVMLGMKLLVQYVAVVATTLGGTNTAGCAAAALVCLRVGARAGQKDSRGTRTDLCTIRCMAARAATERR